MLTEITQIQVSTLTDIFRTEEAISFIKERFGKRLARALNLVNVSAPIAILDGTGINDDLNGVEKPVSFSIKGLGGQKAVIVQSLAKWKRVRLKEFNFKEGMGLLTDMRALRPDEGLSPIHSLYVDQWDWEKCIHKGERALSFLKTTVESIYEVIKDTERDVFNIYPELTPVLPDKIYFIQAEELLQRYPDLSPKERELEVARDFGAVFIIGIGADLSNGKPHDGRAPDYDDWSTINEEGYYGLNGDIILWNPVLQSAFEVSSMGIRVDKPALEKQLELRGCTDRKNLMFHSLLLNDRLPLSIGGGIGQSRICMFYLKKCHIGEVQSGIWPETLAGQYEDGLRLL